jgi:tetratricopeptide (TPR) repeat protein
MQPPRPTPPKSSDAPLWIAGGLAIGVFLVFGQTLRHDFLYYDDGDYITANAMVSRGLTWKGLRWSLTAIVGNLWHPLTLISHMLDVQLFGMRPGLHHFVNVLLHAANAVLAFAVLRRMTGDLWKPAMVAALFAFHPLRAESVAWASERKDVLSALFFFLGLWAYARYAATQRVRDYVLVAGSFALGLSAKPMLVTFPFVLLLLDFWPLQRVIVAGAQEGRRRFRVLVLEKAPLFVLAGLAAGVAVWSQHSTGATGSIEAYPIGARVANAIVAYADYLMQTFRPLDLAVMYPHPGAGIDWRPTAYLFLLLFSITLGVLFAWQRHPYALTGWLWFTGMLVPVSGLVQVGGMAHADRYTYLPHVGLFIAIVWSCGAAVERFPGWRRIAAFAACTVLLALAAMCYVQVRYWRNTITLFEHTVAVSPNSAQAHFNLGAGYALSGRPDLAEPHFRESLRIHPLGMGAKTNLAAALIELGRPAEAEGLLRELIDLDEYQIEYHVQLALALYRQGKYRDALFRVGEALRIDPTYPRALMLADQCRKAAVEPELKVD